MTGLSGPQSQEVTVIRMPNALPSPRRIPRLTGPSARPVIALPGYCRALIRVRDYEAFIEEHTFRDDRVRPT